MTDDEKSFCSEKGYGIEGSPIPKHVYNPGGETHTPSLDFIIGELNRESKKYTKHIPHPQPPTHIYGIEPERLRELEAEIVEGAKHQTETYTRRGKTHTRAQRKTTPVLLVMIASWPSPSKEPTPERERWVRRVVRLAKSRFGKLLKCILAHEHDEERFHLHIVVADAGRPVKRLSEGHKWVSQLLEKYPQAARKEQAKEFRAGMSHMQQWYHSWAGGPFGHVRAPTPRKRMPKRELLIKQKAKLDEAEELLATQKKAVAAALRERKAELEAEALSLRRREQAVAEAETAQARRDKAAQDEILAQAAIIKGALARLHKREAMVSAMRSAVVDQLAVEQSVAQNRYEAPSIF